MQVRGLVPFRVDVPTRLGLAPVEGRGAQVPTPVPRNVPSALDVLSRLHSDELALHPSKVPMTKSAILIAMSNTQRQLKLTPGPAGTWSDEAWNRLAAWLQAEQRQRRISILYIVVIQFTYVSIPLLTSYASCMLLPLPPD
jgi:hypothetical protein